MVSIEAARRKLPPQKPGKSEQTVETPPEFLEAVERRFGPLAWDLACTRENAKAPRGIFYPSHDALADHENWSSLIEPENAWLNPPFGDLRPWVAKCELTATGRSMPLQRGRIFVLLPAAVGAGWFRDHVHEKARVLLLDQRLKFVGHAHPYPKDLVLAIYGQGYGGYERWSWEDFV